MVEYPEHEKLHKVNDKSQTIGEFVEWMRDSKQAYFATEHEHTESCEDDDGDLQCDLKESELIPVRTPITKLLAEFFQIDLDKIDIEKESMLQSIRMVNNAKD